LCQANQVEELDYHVHDKILYHLSKLCIPQGERVNIIREAHSSLTVVHFSVGNVRHYFGHPDDDSIGMCSGSQKDILHEKDN
jgi:hypothetical protein